MGYWKLKDNLNPHECLQIQLGTSSDEDNWCIEDFITWNTKSGKLTDVDREHIFTLIRDGYVEGEVNDWDCPEIGN